MERTPVITDPELLTIAVSKGRIFHEALPLLAKIGIAPVADPQGSRKLVIATSDPSIRLVIIRAADVPTYVEYGAADLGITGKDVLLEYSGDGLYEPLDLKIARCRLMVAGWPDQESMYPRLRVATKYTTTARRFFAELGVQTELIKLYGSMELAPLVGLADRIVDLVDTGNTLKANGLTEIQHVCDISSRLIVNKAAMKIKTDRIKILMRDLVGVIE